MQQKYIPQEKLSAYQNLIQKHCLFSILEINYGETNSTRNQTKCSWN